MQQIFQGVEELGNMLKKFQKVLLVHGKSFEKYSIKDFFASIPCVHFTEFVTNPLYEDVCKGVNLFRNESCDAIVAVGGGSAMDVAKCIKLFSKMEINENYLQQELRDTNIPLIAIPTTAGTGSESTKYAVIYYRGTKQSISHSSIVPDYVFLIPSLLKGLPIYQKKCTILDALCQAIESWWSVNSTDESIAYSKKAIRMIKRNWKGYIFENKDEEAEQIMLASNYAGRAINITATTAAHAMSYKITSMYKLPHGHAVAICLQQVWEYMLTHADDCIDNRGVEYLKRTFAQIEEEIDLSYFKSMLVTMEMNDSIAGDRASDLNDLVVSVNLMRLKNNPIALSSEILRKLYERITR